MDNTFSAKKISAAEKTLLKNFWRCFNYQKDASPIPEAKLGNKNNKKLSKLE